MVLPQGSVLGPLLFLLYINDFSNCSSVLDLHLFADDANLFYSDKKLSDLELVLNVELQKVHIRLCSNKLSLNVNKSNFVIFHSSQKKQTSTVTLTINNEILKEEKCVKYLGTYIDSNPNWRNQVNYMKKKVNRRIGILSKICYYVNINTLINLYYSLVYPFLIYGLIVWGSTYNSTLNPLYLLQKRVLRSMTFMTL